MLVHVSFSTPFNNQQQSWFMAVCQSYSIIIGFAFPSEQSAAPATSKGPSVECRAIAQCLIHHGLQYPIILPRDGRFPQQEVLIDISTAGISFPIVRWFIPSSTQNSAKYEVGFTDVYCTYFSGSRLEWPSTRFTSALRHDWYTDGRVVVSLAMLKALNQRLDSKSPGCRKIIRSARFFCHNKFLLSFGWWNCRGIAPKKRFTNWLSLLWTLSWNTTNSDSKWGWLV